MVASDLGVQQLKLSVCWKKLELSFSDHRDVSVIGTNHPFHISAHNVNDVFNEIEYGRIATRNVHSDKVAEISLVAWIKGDSVIVDKSIYLPDAEAYISPTPRGDAASSERFVVGKSSLSNCTTKRAL